MSRLELLFMLLRILTVILCRSSRGIPIINAACCLHRSSTRNERENNDTPGATRGSERGGRGTRERNEGEGRRTSRDFARKLPFPPAERLFLRCTLYLACLRCNERTKWRPLSPSSCPSSSPPPLLPTLPSTYHHRMRALSVLCPDFRARHFTTRNSQLASRVATRSDRQRKERDKCEAHWSTKYQHSPIFVSFSFRNLSHFLN